MAVTINADTSNGLVITPDTSGNLSFQSSGTNVLQIDSSGNPTFAGQIASANLPDLKTIDGNSIVGTGDIDLKTVNGTSIVGTGDIEVGGGKVLQVLQAVKTDAFSTTSTSYVDLTDLSVSITPSSTSSKILISYNINGGTAGDVCHGYLTLVRNSTEIFKADTASSRRSATSVINTPTQMQLTYSAEYLDSPSTTSATTYKVQILSSNGTAIYINRSGRDTNLLAYDGRTVSSITVMEIAG